MAYVAKFLDNQTVGVDDFNGIIADLCGEGVIPGDDGYNFKTGVPYTMQKLNDMTKDAVYSAGVVPSSETALQVTASGGVATINVGAAVFKSGLIFKVTETETVAYETSVEQYIYLVHDTSANTAEIKVSSDLEVENGSTRFVVALAEIVTSDGEATVTDLRQYAVGKLKCCANWNGTTKADFEYAGGTSGTWNTETVTVWDKGDEVNFIVFVAWTGSGKEALHSIGIVTENSDKTFNILCINAGGDRYTDKIDLRATTGGAYLYDFAHGDGGITATLYHYGSTGSTNYPVDMYVSVVG